MSSASKKRAEGFFHREKEGATALSEHEAKQEVTRLLTAKLRAERLAREAARVKPARDPRKAVKK